MPYDSRAPDLGAILYWCRVTNYCVGSPWLDPKSSGSLFDGFSLNPQAA